MNMTIFYPGETRTFQGFNLFGYGRRLFGLGYWIKRFWWTKFWGRGNFGGGDEGELDFSSVEVPGRLIGPTNWDWTSLAQQATSYDESKISWCFISYGQPLCILKDFLCLLKLGDFSLQWLMLWLVVWGLRLPISKAIRRAFQNCGRKLSNRMSTEACT